MTLAELQEYLWRSIPITRAMDLRVLRLDEAELRILLPLAPNVNHKGTIFGGSIYSACAFTAYALMLDRLRRAGRATTDIIIADGQVRYLRPLTGDAELVATVPDLDRFFTDLAARGKARQRLEVQALGGALCAQFTGGFFVRA